MRSSRWFLFVIQVEREMAAMAASPRLRRRSHRAARDPGNAPSTPGLLQPLRIREVPDRTWSVGSPRFGRGALPVGGENAMWPRPTRSRSELLSVGLWPLASGITLGRPLAFDDVTSIPLCRPPSRSPSSRRRGRPGRPTGSPSCDVAEMQPVHLGVTRRPRRPRFPARPTLADSAARTEHSANPGRDHGRERPTVSS